MAHTQRVIFHVDMDSFYASCELTKYPELKESPFIVGSDPKEGKGRGVVLACNYAARKFGIHSGMPISKAWQLCKEAKYVRPDHRLYGQVSERLMALIRGFSSKVEQTSIDEAYLDVSGEIDAMMKSGASKSDAVKRLAEKIKSAVRESEGITCSIGVAHTKTTAKIATDMHKPDGLTIVEPEDVKAFLAPLPTAKIPGVGKVTQKILSTELHIENISDLQRIALDRLQDRLGRTAVWLKRVADGTEDSEVIPRWEPVSQSGETTFEEDEGNYSKVALVMAEVARDVHERVVKEGYLFKNVGIKIRFSGFETHTRSRMLPFPTESLEIVNRECERMLGEFLYSGKKVRLIGVRLSDLVKKAEEQKTLLEWSEIKQE